MKREITPELARKFCKMIEGLTRNELEQAAKEAKTLSTTNCWWLEWELKKPILEMIEVEQLTRKRR